MILFYLPFLDDFFLVCLYEISVFRLSSPESLFENRPQKNLQVPHPTTSSDATWPLCTSPPVFCLGGDVVTVNGVHIIYRNLCFLFMCTCNYVFFFYGNILAHDMLCIQKCLQLLISK